MTGDDRLADPPVGDRDAFYAALVEDDPEELYESAPCAYLSTLPDGTIVKVNRTFLGWTGFNRTDLVGRRRFQDLLAPGDRIFHETHFSPLLRMQGHVREIAVEVVCASGARLPVLVNSVVRKEPGGAIALIRTALFDATERRSYEQELLAARRRAEESERRATVLARTLQTTLLPPAIPLVPGVDIGGAYRPAGDGSEVGGDFYDVFEMSGGAWGVALGDVCGKGAVAAVTTTRARYTARAEALRMESPAAILRTVSEVLLRDHPDQFCTALLVRLEPGPEGVRLTVASGGHHLPLCRRAAGGFETLGRAGSILGMLAGPNLTDTEVLLAEGDVVVLYTDGVTEARIGGDFFEDHRLHAVIDENPAAGAQELADRIVGAALDFQAGNARDDMAVVVVKATNEPVLEPTEPRPASQHATGRM